MKIKMMVANQEYDTDKQAVLDRQIITYQGTDSRTATYVVSNISYSQECGFVYTVINMDTYETRKIDMIRKNSQRCGVGFYKEDDQVRLLPEEQFHAICRKATAQEEQKTKNQKKSFFYTENGWEGSRYNRQLSTKEITAYIKEYCKKQYPEYKFSVRKTSSVGCTTIDIVLLSGAREVMSESGKIQGYLQTRGVDIDDFHQTQLTPEGYDMLVDITTYARSYNRSDSDGMQDYFDELFYLGVDVGTFDKPYTVVPKKEQAALPQVTDTTTQTIKPNSDLKIAAYSEKAIVVVGDTKPVKDTLKNLGGRFNPHLQIDGTSTPGWVFPKAKEAQLQNMLMHHQPADPVAPIKTNMLKLVEQRLSEAAEPKTSVAKIEQGMLF